MTHGRWWVWILVSLLATGTGLGVRAAGEDNAAAPANAAPHSSELRRAELKKAVPEQRKVRSSARRAGLDKRIHELRKKREAGTVSAREQKQMQRLEKLMQRRGEKQKALASRHSLKQGGTP